MEFALDPDNAPSIVDGVVAMERLDEGPLLPGSRFGESRSFGGRVSSTELELVELDWERGYAMRAEVKGIVAACRYQSSWFRRTLRRPSSGGWAE